MQFSVHPPSPFIQAHQDQLLPAWRVPVTTLLLVLQPAQCCLLSASAAAQAEKDRLRQVFLEFGQRLFTLLHQRGHQVEIFDPPTGRPVFSQPGTLCLDDVAVVQACLGYPTRTQAGCSVVLHPTWGSAVYPATVLTTCPPAELTRLCQTELQLTPIHQSSPGWQRLAVPSRSPFRDFAGGFPQTTNPLTAAADSHNKA